MIPFAKRAFGRIFSAGLPPIYAPTFAQLAFDLNSLAIGILFAVVTPLCLTALFETIRALEDPFVGYISLDGIDVKEEFEVLHWQQLINARRALFPSAYPYAQSSKPAIDAMVPVEDMVCTSGNSSENRVAGNLDSMDGSSRISHFALNSNEISLSASLRSMRSHHMNM